MKPPKKKCRLYTMKDYGKGIPVTKSDVNPPKIMVCPKAKKCFKFDGVECDHMKAHEAYNTIIGCLEPCSFPGNAFKGTKCVPVKKARANK